MIVMDPLAAPLSCPCVQGYAQRRYEKLAEYLQQELQRQVKLVFDESLVKALEGRAGGQADLVIGKDSVVRFEADKAQLPVKAVARLTGKDGGTTQTGLLVVPTKDPAKQVGDLDGYRIFFGPDRCQEKHDAAIELLRSHRVAIPATVEVSQACSDGACRALELSPKVHAAAVISSYAQPLLEGCGTVDKGALRVVGETKPVPFITAFVTNRVSAEDAARIEGALLAAGTNRGLCQALESLLGFVPAEVPGQESSRNGRRSGESEGWTGWRGPRRDGICQQLPRKLPDTLQIVWSRALGGPGLGGLAATERYVVLGDRDLDNLNDEFRCFDARDGSPLWTVRWPAPGKLDYGNTPRATPLIADGFVYLFGAFGDLHAVRLDSGEVVWSKNVRLEFGVVEKLIWGTCSSPLLVDGRLIVNPGAEQASIVALDPSTGNVLWECPGAPAAFGSLIAATFGGVRQIVGYDRTSLGGWDVRTGTRLWKLAPPEEGDFNVPTPVVVGERLLVATENNGTRLYAFRSDGTIIAEPVAVNGDLAPDMSTPVVVGDRLFCVWDNLYCLDVRNGLKTLWAGSDKAFGTYGAVMGGDERVLVLGLGGQLVLVDATADNYQVVSRLCVFSDGAAEFYSYPALVGHRIYMRGDSAVVCVDLGQG